MAFGKEHFENSNKPPGNRLYKRLAAIGALATVLGIGATIYEAIAIPKQNG